MTVFPVLDVSLVPQKLWMKEMSARVDGRTVRKQSAEFIFQTLIRINSLTLIPQNIL